MTQESEANFSARKTPESQDSPHFVRTDGSFSPHPAKNREKRPQRYVYEYAENYSTAFQHAPDKFWSKLESLRGIEKRKLELDKLILGRATLNEVTWRSQFPNPLPDRFVSAFVDAVRDRNFPKGREAQARFLGKSLGAEGNVSARRSRDIYGEEKRARAKRMTNHTEIYINCCGKKRWTNGLVCPECGLNPLITQNTFSLSVIHR